MSKLAKRYRKRNKSNPSSPRHNPPLLADLVELAVPAAGGFAAARLLTKLAIAAAAKKWPTKAKYIGAGGAVTGALAIWFVAHKWKWIAKWHGPIAAGAFLGAAVNVLQIFIPKLGWLVGDPTALTAGGTAAQKAVDTANATSALPAGFEELQENPADWTYNDKYDAGRYAANDLNKQQPAQPPAERALEDETWGNSMFGGGLAGLGN